MFTRSKVIVFLGAPGSGKGTQATRLSEKLGIPVISTGDMLRRECASGSALGKAVKSVLDSGQLVNDDLMNKVVASRLAQFDCQNGCILDGYPRTVSQARFLARLLAERNMPEPVVFNLEVPTDQIVSRLSLRGRSDDNPLVIRERLKLYHQNASELVRYYSANGYHAIDGNRSPEEVSEDLLSLVETELPLHSKFASTYAQTAVSA